jgi:hypothetical protein
MSNNAFATNADRKFIGWDTSRNESFTTLFNKDNVAVYQSRITELLQGVEPTGRPIIVPIDTILSVLYQCYESNRPQVGDIYSRYIQAEYTVSRDDLSDIVNRAMNIIVSTIRTEYGVLECNKRLTVWNTVLGEFNKEGLRSHSQIKLRRKRPEPMQFNMNY